MIVVKSNDKSNYLTALHQCDVAVGAIPSVGAHAKLEQIKPLVDYLTKCTEHSLSLSIKAANGEDITEADDWKKKLKTKYANKINKPALSDEIKADILDNEYSPLLERIDTELSELYSIFKSVRFNQASSNDKMKNYNFITFSIDGENQDLSTSIYTKVEFFQFCYKYDIYSAKNDSFEKSIFSKELTYSDSLSDQDKNDIINGIGNYLYNFVETKGANRHN